MVLLQLVLDKMRSWVVVIVARGRGRWPFRCFKARQQRRSGRRLPLNDHATRSFLWFTMAVRLLMLLDKQVLLLHDSSLAKPFKVIQLLVGSPSLRGRLDWTERGVLVQLEVWAGTRLFAITQTGPGYFRGSLEYIAFCTKRSKSDLFGLIWVRKKVS